MTNTSIVAFRQQLTSEREAAHQGLSGLASVASHRSIAARMERAWQHLQTLQAAGQEHEAQALLTSEHFYEACEEAACSLNQ
jgi:hypothetical protein